MKKKNLEFRFLFSLLPRFWSRVGGPSRGGSASRDVEDHGVRSAPGPWTEVSWDAWSENYRDLGKDRAGMQCSKFQPSPRLGFDLALLLVLT